MTFESGSTFGHYQIIEPLGRGGMASVYRAYEPGLDRYVALKILPKEFLHDEGFAERFSREAKVVARLEHPNIIPIHNFGIEETTRTPWMAMRLISGGALSGIMKKARLPVTRTVAILRGAAEALDYAHGKGVIHRDVKPQNILLDEAERVYLADFGIAKMVESQSGLTATGMITGTPQYMAPEQAMGGTVDHRADIYALGIVSYEMLTGRVPFAADTPVAVLMKHVSDSIPVPSTMEVPEPLMRALLKALAKRPEDRWPSAVAFVNALEQGLGTVSEVGDVPPGAPTTFLPQDHQTPRTGTPATPPPIPAPRTGAQPAVATGAGMLPPTVLPGYAPGYPTPYPGTPVPGAYPATAPPGYPGAMYAGTPAPGTYPAAPPPYPGTPPPGTYPGAPYSAAYPASAHPSGGGGGKGLIIGLVAGVVLLGVAGAIVLVMLLRPGAPTTADQPERTPVTLRSPAVAEEPSPLAAPEDQVPSTTLTGAPSTTAAPRPSAPTRALPATTAPTRVAEVPPIAVPTAGDATPARPAAPSFPGAGKVDAGGNYYEKTLAYSADQPLSFDGHVGPLKVSAVTLTVTEKKGRFSGVDALRMTVHTTIPSLECPNGAGEWDFKFFVELLDEGGRRLDRLDHGGSCENEIKTVSFDRAVLKALLPSVKGVRVRMEASKD